MIVKAEKQEYPDTILDLEDRDENGQVWWTFGVRFDGCVHVHRYCNAPKNDSDHPPLGQDSDYLHVCDLDELIEKLQEVRRLRAEWPGHRE